MAQWTLNTYLQKVCIVEILKDFKPKYSLLYKTINLKKCYVRQVDANNMIK